MTRRINIWESIDWFTVIIYLALVLMGWLNIYAVVYDENHSSIFDFTQRYGKQFVWILAAIFIGLVIMIIDSNFYTFFAYIFYGVSVLLLVSVLFVGKTVNAAKAWIEIGSFGLQPSEFVKFTAALALAKYINVTNFKIHQPKNLFFIGLILFFPAAIILLQNDTGSAVVYVAFFLVLFREGLSPWVLVIGFVSLILFFAALIADKISLVIFLTTLAYVMYYLLNMKWKPFVIGLSIFIGSLGIVYLVNMFIQKPYSFYYVYLIALAFATIIQIIIVITKRVKNTTMIIIFLFVTVAFTFTIDYVFYNVLGDHQQNRINELLGVSSDPLGAGYNVNQSKIAIGSGGFWGKGYLNGTQTKYNFVPEQSTDFIFCTVGEEWGFVGSTVVITLFLALLLRLIFLAERQRSVFSRVYGYCVASILFFHVSINVGMTLGIVPVIGIPLPFFSYGGSSLWAFTILLFIFIRLDSSRKELLA
ncbi:MAG: rod shape-determining protein RodA [Bacteroidetes bacterium HGW-Bacteroidetes-21]|jgi:rod shape determining protein RodA|nr:MAG: rod shape-determining protein RodA [Bacteroidetes bacterium HGW-Bacteroidetes-21]